MNSNNNNAMNWDKGLMKFFILTFLFSWSMWLPGLLCTYNVIEPTPFMLKLSGILQWVGGIGPSFAAFFLVSRKEGWRGFKNLFKRVFQFRLGRWYWPVLLLMPVAFILAHLFNMLVTGRAFPVSGIMKEPWFIPLLFLVFFILQMSEEYGWRGYALDRLQQKQSALVSSLVLGIVWVVWHVPMFYSRGFPQYEKNLPYLQFAISFVFVTVIITWFQNNCGSSLVPAFIGHCYVNLLAEVFPLVGKDGDISAWVSLNIVLFVFVVVITVKWGYRKLKI